MRLHVDFENTLGKIRPMHAVGQPPFTGAPNDERFRYLTEAHIPYSRLHDVGGSYGGNRYVDIPNIFRDFDADENDPASYDFAFTDWLISALYKADCEPIYRLGVTIETAAHIKAYRIFPPKDFAKWARVCEHIIRHYNEGWADGYRMGIEYWEIWNEPDLDQPDDRWKTDPRTWAGTMEQFDELYVVAAKHLKKCFPDLKIGGPAFANPRKYGPDFLDFVKAEGAPLDFFSHHMYHRKPARIVEDVRIIRRMLDDKGFTETESILNEWNFNRGWDDESDLYGRRVRPTIKGAAFVAATMCACQNEPLDMLMYYDLRPNTIWCGPWSPQLYEIRPTYWSLYYWAELADYGTWIESGCDTGNIYTCAALSEDGRKIRLLVARYHVDDNHDTPREIALSLPAGWQVGGLRITDSTGMDRRLPASGEFVMESNSLALLEIIATFAHF